VMISSVVVPVSSGRSIARTALVVMKEKVIDGGRIDAMPEFERA
jgi:hypothetical protein